MADEILKEVQDGIAEFFKDEKDEKQRHRPPYWNIEKASVLQAARDFHDSTRHLCGELPNSDADSQLQCIYHCQPARCSPGLQGRDPELREPSG